MAFLITGRAGSGKSTVCLELKRRGYEAFDGDEVPGLAGWIDLKTGQKTAVDYGQYVDYTKVSWNWDAAVLRQFIADHPQAFLCGSASNQLSFHKAFAEVFVLELGPAAHRQRLESRESSYAKDQRQVREILQEQQALVREARRLGAVLVDAAQPVSRIASGIVSRHS